jgi:hypothetical protein
VIAVLDSVSGVWTGARYVHNEAELRADLVFCGYCGKRMREVLHPEPEFDRRTGAQSKTGKLYWECPKRGIGMNAVHGDWAMYHDENPHDSVYLREAAA